MAVFKCKMCGGDLNIDADINVVECEYCGTTQTVPTADNEKKMSLFARANKLRAAFDFDKAAGVYESIVTEFPEEAEAYWGLILCKYGIEYVDDPATGKKVPTCHRSSFDCILDDSDFEMVMENADSVARKVYRDEAKAIEELRKAIIEISGKEEPYDIFICYKETAENGDRTIDSVIAQDVYDELTAKGYRVFFSRITLEDKLGQEYEPYIFAALNSAKVMLAFGTDYEYYNAVWVKNEWSRFLQLISKGEKKTLIPCYKNIDAYDMPKEFAKLQAQDMGKVGAVQDLLRGIEKIIPKNESVQAKETVVVSQSGGPNVEALLKRGNNALEDGNFVEAKTHFDKVLDIEAECAEAYLGLAMADEELCNLKELIFKKSYNKNYQRAKQYATGELLTKIGDIECEFAKIFENKKNSLSEYRKNVQAAKICIYATSERTVALMPDGTIVANDITDKRSRNDAAIEYTDDWFDLVSLAVCGGYTIGLTADGTVLTTPVTGVDYNDYGQCAVKEWTDIIDISTSGSHTLGLKNDGTVVATGQNKDGQCNVKDWVDIKAIFTCGRVSIGLKKDGTFVFAGDKKHIARNISCWKNIVSLCVESKYCLGLVADGSVVAISEFDNSGVYINEGQCNVDEWIDIVDIATSGEHTIGLKADGTVIATGRNDEGQCDVKDWTDIVAVVAGYNHTVGLKKDGTLVFAGRYLLNECNDEDWKLFDDFSNLEDERKTKTAANTIKRKEECRLKEEELRLKKEYCANQKIVLKEPMKMAKKLKGIMSAKVFLFCVKTDGTVHSEYSKKNNWTDIVSVASGHECVLGVKADGTVVADGENKYGACDVECWTDIVSVAVSTDFFSMYSAGLKSDGTVVTTKIKGSRYDGGFHDYEKRVAQELESVKEWTDIVDIAIEGENLIGLKADGTVISSTGYIDDDCCDEQNVKAIAANKDQVVFLYDDGTVYATDGEEVFDEIDNWTDIIAITIGCSHIVGLKADGTVVAAGENKHNSCNVEDWTDIVAIEAGVDKTYGIKKDGTVVAVGFCCSSHVSKSWKLFDNYENLEEERKTKMSQLKEQILSEKTAKEQAVRRKLGRCQHCGGMFKGLFTKKCANCGKEKDY